MARKRMEVAKLMRLEARTRAIRGAGWLAFFACCIALGFVVVATAFPQRRALAKLEVKLGQARQLEQTVMAEREHRSIELRALREDPEYLEMQARDRLNYSRDGEKVLRFKRDE